MPFVDSAIVLVGMLCLLDMLMTFAVLRRLREHQARLDDLPVFNDSGGPAYSAKFEDRPLPGFSARAIDGTDVSPGFLAGAPGLIGVFRVDCGPCHEQLPGFLELAGQADGAAMSVVTGADGNAAKATEMIGHLTGAPAVSVVSGPDADALAEALGVNVFPTFLRVDAAGVVVRAETHLSMMGAPDPADVAGG